jgi:hypothetical protein
MSLAAIKMGRTAGLVDYTFVYMAGLAVYTADLSSAAIRERRRAKAAFFSAMRSYNAAHARLNVFAWVCLDGSDGRAAHRYHRR